MQLGTHILIELSNCNASSLDNAKLIEEALLKAADLSGATILNHKFHKFAPQGVSGVVIIAESHFSIHTWPEHRYAAIDFFTCSEKMNWQLGLDHLSQTLQSENVTTKIVPRGPVTSPSSQASQPNSLV